MKKFPIITKDEIVRDGINISMDYDGFINQDSINIINVHTFGSTGKCMNVYWNRADFN